MFLAFWEPSRGLSEAVQGALGCLGWLLGGSWAVLRGLGCSWPALASSLGGPGVAAIPKLPNPRTYSLYRY